MFGLLSFSIFALIQVHGTYITHKTIDLKDLGPPSKHRLINSFFNIQPQTHMHPSLNSLTIANLKSNKNHKNNIIDINEDNPIIYPTDYGADPFNMNDSTIALNKAISVALSRGVTNTTLSNNITDLGGVTIDLQGGSYLISSPLYIPPMYGNIVLIDGTIRASTKYGFKTESNDIPSYLLIIGNWNLSQPTSETCTTNQGTCNQHIGIENLMFDCNHVCDGGLYVRATTDTHVGPQMFFLGLCLYLYVINDLIIFGLCVERLSILTNEQDFRYFLQSIVLFLVLFF